MRFPPLSDLDREQRRVYAEAPADGAILVVGAPGTGKTVMAFHRAQKVRALGQRPHVIMFGSVLQRYTSSGQQKEVDVPSSTMHVWARDWWRMVFHKWPPRLSKWEWDWEATCAQALSEPPPTQEKLNWGHLIVDEGQDFPPEMYVALGLMCKGLKASAPRPAVTIFADDNQRLQIDRNSETKGIRNSLFINGCENRNFTLRRNFRNSAEIAKFSAYFRVGQASGKAELPDRRGDLPSVLLSTSQHQMSDFIARKVKGSPGKQIGVIVHGPASEVKRTFERLESRIDSAVAVVQMYVSGTKALSADSLDFESNNTVTVLHQNSAKGLEFDIVFFVGLERMDLSGSGGINERMAIYVMCSRARSELFLTFIDIDAAAPLPPSIAMLPPPAKGLCRYVGLGEINNSIQDALSRIDWIEPIDCEADPA